MQNKNDYSDSPERPSKKRKSKAKKGQKPTKRPADIEVNSEESKDSSDEYADSDSDDDGFQRKKKKDTIDIRGDTVPTKGKNKNNDESHMTYKSAMDRSSINSRKRQPQTIEEFVAREFGSQFYDLVFKLSQEQQAEFEIDYNTSNSTSAQDRKLMLNK